MMENADADELHLCWRIRNNVDARRKFKWRKLLWMELQRRHPDRIMQPIKLRIPYVQRIDIVKVRQHIFAMIDGTTWPNFMKEWHKKALHVTTCAQPSIADSLANVTKLEGKPRECCCAKFCKEFEHVNKIDGHVFMIGREFTGDAARVFGVVAGNIPMQTWYDAFRTWECIRRQLPVAWQPSRDVWKDTLFQMTRQPIDSERVGDVPTTKEVMSVKRRVGGMVIGSLDKNPGELSVVCPELYYRALEGMHGVSAGYEKIYPARLSAYRKRRYTIHELPEQIIRSSPLPPNQSGSEADLMALWKRIYQQKGWAKYARWGEKAGLNQPYVLFKAKNVIESDTRMRKWMKARPISPGTRHPLKPAGACALALGRDIAVIRHVCVEV